MPWVMNDEIKFLKFETYFSLKVIAKIQRFENFLLLFMQDVSIKAMLNALNA